MSSRLPSRICLLCDVHSPQFVPRRTNSSLGRSVGGLPQHRRKKSTWTETINSESKLVQDPCASTSSKMPSNFPFPSIINPLKLVAPEMSSLTGNIRMLLGSGQPTLAKVAKYYISNDGGKHIRPLIVLLVSKALSYNRPISRRAEIHDQDIPISPLKVLNDDNPESQYLETESENETTSSGITASQRRLAEITEMIHA